MALSRALGTSRTPMQKHGRAREQQEASSNTGASNLLVVLRESAGQNNHDEAPRPPGRVAQYVQ
jgi:hypothetical protein